VLDLIEEEFAQTSSAPGMGARKEDQLNQIFERVAKKVDSSSSAVKSLFYRHQKDRPSFTWKSDFHQILTNDEETMLVGVAQAFEMNCVPLENFHILNILRLWGHQCDESWPNHWLERQRQRGGPLFKSC
jgi:hypothetical protein